jgi:hypothetical protein
VTTHWIITIESQVVKLVLEEHNIITFSLNLKVIGRVID